MGSEVGHEKPTVVLRIGGGRPKMFTDAQAMDFVKLYQSGKSATEIATKYKTTAVTILKYLRKVATVVRPNGK